MDEETVKDVVCGMEKPKSQFKFLSEYNGKTYYFCSQQDKEMFNAQPDRWVEEGGEKR